LGIPTAYFKEITPLDGVDKETCIKSMAEKTVTICQQESTLAGKSVFLKHVNGGGGRGSQKITDITVEQAQDVIRKIVNETGGNLQGVYVEAALDFKGRRLMQLELECNGEKLIEPMIRLVWFNRFYQKVFEVGCTQKASERFIPPAIYEACRSAAQQLIQTSGYDNRGTIEILISTDDQGHYDFYVSEINMRRQVEAPAIEGLVKDKQNLPRNTTAEQVMKSCGHPAPTEEDFQPAGPEFIGHVRLLCGQFSEKGTTYPNGLVIDGAFVPHGVDVQYVRGPLHLDADAQLGRALIPAQTWEELCDKLLRFAQEFQFYGPKTETSNYFYLFKKLAVDPVFRAGKLGCNETFNVFSNPPVDKGKNQKIVEALAYTVTPLITDGYRPGQGVVDQSFPTTNQIKAFRKFKEGLAFETVPTTPFSKWIEHRDFDRYILELQDHLANHGGGTMTVMRDVLQSSGDQESALIQKSHTQLVETHGASSGIIVASEEGGAQGQAGAMRGFDWRSVLLSGCPSNLMPLWLMRSKWMNGLEVKSYAKQAFIAKVISKMIAQHYGWPADLTHFVPWPANNFHAGNHPEADRTNRLLLDAGIPVIPNFAWDPRYSHAQIVDWIDCQINLFSEAQKPLYQIRIKNPGQGPKWTANVIVNLVTLILHKFSQRGLPKPIIHIHNHEFDGRAAHIAAEAIKQYQKMGYRWLILDSAPPGTSHNSNLIIANALQMSAQEREHLMAYNHGAQLILDITTRFNNQSITKRIQDPNSEMAGGTNSSDLADATKLGILPQDIPKAIALAKGLLG
jgi:biotin carboxylase